MPHSYLSTMSNALEVGQKGAEHRQAALHKVSVAVLRFLICLVLRGA